MFLTCPTCAVVQTTTQGEIKLEQVSLFKNGLGFFILEVAIPPAQNFFTVIPPAAPSHGSFWVSYPPEVNMNSLIAKEVELTEQVDVITIAELLKANIGCRVRATYADKEVTGVIKYFAEDRQEPKPNPYMPGGVDAATAPSYRNVDYSRGRLAIIETNAGQICIDPQSLTKVEFLDGGAKKTVASNRKSAQLEVRLGAPAGGKKMTVSYLAKGITWAPSYMVDITDASTARISAKAELINEVCDLNDVTVQLITGFPHVQFSDTVSPLALKENLAQFLQSLNRGESERGRLASVSSNVAMQQQRADFYYDRSAVLPAYGAAEIGKVQEDLFFYPVKNVHIKKGEVCYLPLFTESVPYKHIYLWEIPDYVDEERGYYEQDRDQRRENIEQVWHCLRLENNTKVPWTTAPAETVKQELILGQDTLNYTPVAGKATLRITQAVNVKAEQIELETDRKRDAAQLYGYHYDLVTVEGKLSVANFQQKPISLEITKTLSGEVKSSDPEAKIEKMARGLRRMNGLLKLAWTIELQPGEQKQIKYVYDVYVRR
jgi:hypothetical protein